MHARTHACTHVGPGPAKVMLLVDPELHTPLDMTSVKGRLSKAISMEHCNQFLCVRALVSADVCAFYQQAAPAM